MLIENNRGGQNCCALDLRLAEVLLVEYLEVRHVETLVNHALDATETTAVAQWSCSLIKTLVQDDPKSPSLPQSSNSKHGAELCTQYPGFTCLSNL